MQSNAHRSRSAIFSSACTALLLSEWALAQDATATRVAQEATTADPATGNERQGADSTADVGVQEIVVTARKRAESLQNVPAAVTAITEQTIQRYNLSSLESVAASTPEFTVARASNGSGASLSLRGIGSSVTSIGIEQSVATVIDGIYYGQGRVINEGLFDMQRIEILKGPQSLFFGKGSTAGVVSITTADPTDKLEMIGRITEELQAHQLIGEAIVSTPLSDTLGLRVAIRGSEMSKGYYENVGPASQYTTFDAATGNVATYISPVLPQWAPQEKLYAGRVTLKWAPNEQITGTIKASFNRNRTGNPSWNYVIYDCPDTAAIPADQPCERKFRSAMNGLPAELADVMPLARGDGDLTNRYNSGGVTGTLNFDAGWMSLTSVSNYNRNTNTFFIDGDYTTSPTNENWETERDRFTAYSTELRALTNFESPFNLLAGAYYQRTKLDSSFYAVIGGLENSAAAPESRYLGFSKASDTTDSAIAGYVQGIWNPKDTIELTAGARYTKETKKSHFVQPYVNPLLAGVFLENQPFSDDRTFNNWSPEVTLRWTPVSDIVVYGAFKTGFKSGGFSNTGIQSAFGSPDDFKFAPEKAKGFELGLKTVLLDRQLRLNFAAYQYKFTDLQVDFFNSTTVSFITTNAGGAKTDGAEVELDFAPRTLSGFSVHGSANYNKARYTNYIAPCVAGQTISEGCNLVAHGVPSQQLNGLPTANAPRWTAAVGANFETSLAGGLTLGLSTDARYSDDYLFSAFGNGVARQASYVNLDAAARLTTENRRWEFAVIGRNLTDKFVLTGGYDLVGTGSGTGAATGLRADQVGVGALPRTVQLQATYRY